ncbi:alpha/beta hydrolase [Hymenobacter sp. DH14]|uniref:Alpha/beta hydrolase n=1 Tax=Hymenobacter cyanobacteriorum TaxID=2926463 RepID=A0A9X1VL15_9BACT|nr:alpha/beta fold hydrolase [Hymenobacter cyanobacteriorum]MCI1190127.1 alpha/beta hydrolase [Hymenobacter cyanobacteriorum]
MKVVLIVVSVVAALYVLLCGILYFKQEKLLFAPTHLPAGYQFHFPGQVEERWTTAADGTQLHGLLFKVPEPKGLIFYLHGNGGALDSWGDAAATYTALHYDMFLLDYRGYGKSGGSISNQGQMLADVDTVYRQLLPEYPENRTVILGYSLGTGPATWLAARHHPKLLVLQAPYFSMRDMAARLYPFVPGFLLRYPMPTNELITQVSAPIVLFHGDRDEVIDYNSTLRLKALLKPTDRLVVLPGARHNGMTDNSDYRREIAQLLK